MKTAIICAVHIQPSEEWVTALHQQYLFKKADIIIVDDSDGKVKLPKGWKVYNYKRQRAELGDTLYKQFEQFHHSSACKNFGTWLAYKKGYENIIVIDSDCIVPAGFVKHHLESLDINGRGWENPLSGTGYYSRGFPYSKRNQKKWAHMGLWVNELDLYGTDRVGKENLPTAPRECNYDDDESRITGYNACGFFPLSGMNVAFRREAIPYMLFLPNFTYSNFNFTRHDDIWGGYIFEKISHAKNKALSYGMPYVYHDTVVIPEEDADEEVAMIKFEDAFYKLIDNSGDVFGSELTPSEIFTALAWHASNDEIFSGLASAFRFWAEAFM